jgi:hypothetical protein
MIARETLPRLEHPDDGLFPRRLLTGRIDLALAGIGTRNEPEMASLPPEESLVADARGGLTPSQMVDGRLGAMLGSLSVSRMPNVAAHGREHGRGQESLPGIVAPRIDPSGPAPD